MLYRLLSLLLFTTALMLLVGCGGSAEPDIEATAVPTATAKIAKAAPTATPAPTATLVPTTTPVPTATLTPAAVGNDAETPKQGNTRREKGSQNGDGRPPALIKSLGYDFSTGVVPILIVDYGTLSLIDSRHVKYNLQPTFVLPAGTKVTAIIDGVVCSIPKLYSGDYSIMMAPSCDTPKYMWEMEHVINVTVEVGDRVRAGQPVAEVSDYSYEYGDPQGRDQSRPDRKYGFDLVEIGLLEGGEPPVHHCPWLYIDPSYKEELLGMMTEARKSIETETAGTPNSEYIHYFLEEHITDWETPDGKPLYNTTDYQAPGCKITNIIGDDGMPIPD